MSDTNTAEAVETEANPLEQAAEQKPQDEPKAEGKTDEKAEDKPEEDKPAKKEKTPEEKEIARLRRRVDNLTRRLYESGARQNTQDLPNRDIERDNQQQQADSEELRLSRAELKKLIEQRASELAPTIKQQADEIEHRRQVVEKLSSQLGKERFDQLADDLDSAFGGLQDDKGKPRAAVDAIFDTEDPAALIEYLADPDNAAEAEALSRMNDRQAGRAIAKLEDRLAAKRQAEKAAERPKRSNAPAPVETAKSGGVSNGMPDPSNTKAWIAWRNAQEGGR